MNEPDVKQTGAQPGTQNVIQPEDHACIAPWQFAQLSAHQAGTVTDSYGKTSVALGAYERISPDGRFVLRSFSGGRLGDVSLIELGSNGQVVQAIDTPLSNEAFPVQGSWRYLVDVNGDHYTFNSVLRSKSVANGRISPVFKGGMTGFYAAAAELPASKSGHVRIRSLSWPNANGGENQGEGALVSRTIEVDTASHTITADSGFTNLCTGRVGDDGPLYALPMISVDGEEFAALPQTPLQGQPHMRIFGFGALGKACEPRSAFNFSSGKTIFGYPQSASSGADLAYEYRGQVWWYHRGAGVGSVTGDAGGGMAFNIAPYFDNPNTHFSASAFPGITRDGRVIYAATLKDCGQDTTGKQCTERNGYVVADPYQSNAWQAFLRQHRGPARRQCITRGDVARERAAFAQFHGIAP